jgi:hypothetical protein
MVGARIVGGDPADFRPERFAHSGAIIGAHHAGGRAGGGEVPLSGPTILQQCDNFTDRPEAVDLVLLDGGINDISDVAVLNPFDILPLLSSRTEQACYHDMLQLLKRVSAKFTKPDCKILVTGYFQIVSEQSDPLGVRQLLSLHGIALPDFLSEVTILDPVADRCEQFLVESDMRLRQAVGDAGDDRVSFVPSGFGPSNAIFAPEALLFGLDEQLNPLDPVAADRRQQCDLAFQDPHDFVAREVCYRASAGHPNQAGAVKYKQQILAALRRPLS